MNIHTTINIVRSIRSLFSRDTTKTQSSPFQPKITRDMLEDGEPEVKCRVSSDSIFRCLSMSNFLARVHVL